MLASPAVTNSSIISTSSDEASAVKAKQNIPRRLSFGSATEEEPTFPMQNYVQYVVFILYYNFNEYSTVISPMTLKINSPS